MTSQISYTNDLTDPPNFNTLLGGVIGVILGVFLQEHTCERSGKPVIGDHRKPTWSRCSGRRVVTLAGSSGAGVGGGDLEAVVFA
jgi:hypothetical protein